MASWAGDVLLGVSFAAGLAAFAAAHLAYVVLFVGPARTRRPPWPALLHVVWLAVLVRFSLFRPDVTTTFPDPWRGLSILAACCAGQGVIAVGVLRRLQTGGSPAAAPTASAVAR